MENRPGASRYVILRDGEVLADECTGANEQTLFMSWSAFKPMLSTLVFQARERGELELDQPLRWLKAAPTTREVLQHRSGLDLRWLELFHVADQPAALEVVAGQRRRRSPRARAHYQVLSYGVVLAEVLYRATGQELSELLESRILGPLNLIGQGYLGLPAELDSQGVRLSGVGPLGIVARVANRPGIRRAAIPSGGFWTTPMTLARFYEGLVAGKIPGITEPVLQEMTSETFSGRDGTIGIRTRWAQGIALGVESSFFIPGDFGHNGSNLCVAFYDTENQVSASLMTSHFWLPRRAVKQFNDFAQMVRTI